MPDRRLRLSNRLASRPHRPLLAIALCGWLSACGNTPSTPVASAPTAPTPMPVSSAPTAQTPTPQAPVPVPSAPTPQPPTPQPPSTPTPLPAPTLTLSQSTVTLTDGQSLSLPLQVSRQPDRVEVGGAPVGLTAQARNGQLTLQAQGVQAGNYTVTVTGFWGQEKASAAVQVTVVAPAVTPPPAAPTPDFSLGLGQERLTLTQGQRGSLSVSVSRNAALTGDVQLAAVSAPAGLQTSLSGQTLSLDAAQAPVGSYRVTVTGTAAGLTRQTQLVVDVVAAPAQVSNVQLSADTLTLQAGQSTNLRALVSGSGAFNSQVSWAVAGDAGVLGQLQESGNGSATLSIPVTTAAGQLRVTATSVQDPTRSAQVVLTVKAAPQTVKVDLPQNGGNLSTGGSLTLNYQGAARSVELAQPTALISRVELRNATEQGGQVALMAGTQSGSGTVQLAFNMADGSRFVLGVPVTVEAPAPAPQPAPAPAPAPSSGYFWYPESQRSVQAEERDVLRLTNEIRAKGATCGTTVYPPAPALTWNDQLAYAARNHALDMGKRGYFDHATPEGVKFSQRITEAGYRWQTVGENIAAGYTSAAEVVDGWLKSPGHCVNMMNPAFTEMGAGKASVNTSPYGVYWAQEFGKQQ